MREGGVNKWATEHNSEFRAAKDQVLHLSQRRVLQAQLFRQEAKWVLERRPNLDIAGYTMKSSKAVKLVGIWLDENLTFKEQGAAAVAKGQEGVVNFRRLGKVVGGVHLVWIRHLYLAICVPRMLYGAEVWLALVWQRMKGTNCKHDGRVIVKKLETLLQAGRLMLGTMASSLNAHADLLPMLLVIDKLLQKAATRSVTMPKTHPLHAAVRNAMCYQHVKKYLSPLHFLMKAYTEVIPEAKRKAGWKAPVDVCMAETKDEAKKWVEEETSKVALFLDESLIDGMVGAAVLLCVDRVVKRVKGVQLGTAEWYGVYEAEGVGMVLALE
ncbi:hypothetical protein DFH08DRAFT_712554, partial [Mycena albidolilacea]